MCALLRVWGVWGNISPGMGWANSHPRIRRQCLLQVQKQEADTRECFLLIPKCTSTISEGHPRGKCDCLIRSLPVPKPTAPYSLTAPTPTLYCLQGILKNNSPGNALPLKKRPHDQMYLGNVAYPMFFLEILQAHCHILASEKF